MRGSTVPALLSLVVLGSLLWALRPAPPPSPGEDAGVELRLYCAAGIRLPVEKLAAEYEARYGVRVIPQFGWSGAMLSALKIAGQGDLYLAGDDSFTDTARDEGLVAEVLTLAEMRPVIGVPLGNPGGVQGLADLARVGLRVGIGNPDTTAVGRATRALLSAEGSWESVLANRKVAHTTVNELATALEAKSLDAAVLWDATARQHDLEFLRVPTFEAAAPSHITLGVLTTSERPTAALRFARFVASSDVGRRAFEDHGFRSAATDPWAESPRLELLAGAMLNAAVDETIRAWATREGVVVDFKYNGCGILVDELRSREGRDLPDAYFSCDQTFLDMVQPMFEEGVVVSTNPIVIVTDAGNPRGLTGLASLAGADLRVGLAHPSKSALGALTAGLLEREGLAEALQASGNVKLESPTGDTLVNQLRTGSLDAVVVYTSNAARAGEAVTRVPIALQGASASQPFAVGVDTPYPALVARLFDEVASAPSRTRFEELGFGWELPADGR